MITPNLKPLVQIVAAPPPVVAVAGFTNVCYVDINGNDATGQRGSLQDKFLTIAGALAQSLTGDVILCGPGVFALPANWTEDRQLVGHGVNTTILTGNCDYLPAGAGDQVFFMADVQTLGNFSINTQFKPGGAWNSWLIGVRIGGSSNMFGTGTNHVFSFERVQWGGNVFWGSGSFFFDGCECGIFSGGFIPNMLCATLACIFNNFVELGAPGAATGRLEQTGCIFRNGVFLDGQGAWITTGCQFTPLAPITINGGINWDEYGCTYRQSDVGGTSGIKHVSFQRFSANVPGAATTTIPLGIPIGNPNYFVACTQLTNNSAITTQRPLVVTNKSFASFDVTSVMDAAENFEFGVSYRV